jgi:hypothetical protein
VISLPLCEGKHHDEDFQSSRYVIQAELDRLSKGNDGPILFDEALRKERDEEIAAHQNSISSNVLSLQQMVPPIALGFTPLSIIGDMCQWFKNASTTVARKRSIPEKAVERGRAIVVGLMDALRRLAPLADMLMDTQGRPHKDERVDCAMWAAQFGSAALDSDEAELNRLSEGVIRLKGHTASAQEAMAHIIRDFLSFLDNRLILKANMLAQQSEAILRCIAGDDGEGIAGSRCPPLSRMDAARRISVEALARALHMLLPHVLIGRNSSQEPESAQMTPELLIQRSLTVLAISEFNTRSSRFSIPWLRDALLIEGRRCEGEAEHLSRVETTDGVPLQAFLSCLMASYLSLTSASGRASVVLSSDLASRR